MRYFLLATAASLGVTGHAQAQTPGPYIGIEGGPTFPSGYSGDLDTGFDVDAVAGYNFDLFRLEGELSRKRVSGGEGRNAQLLTAIVNGLVYYGAAGYGVYAGAGAGRARARAFSESEKAWAGQLIVGANAPIVGMLTGGLKYRYLRTGKVQLGEEVAGRFNAHSVLVSLVYNFGPPLPDPPRPDLPPLGEPKRPEAADTEPWEPA